MGKRRKKKTRKKSEKIFSELFEEADEFVEELEVGILGSLWGFFQGLVFGKVLSYTPLGELTKYGEEAEDIRRKYTDAEDLGDLAKKYKSKSRKG